VSDSNSSNQVHRNQSDHTTGNVQLRIFKIMGGSYVSYVNFNILVPHDEPIISFLFRKTTHVIILL